MNSGGPQQVLKFWFEETTPKQWWKVDAGFDQLIRRRFLEVHRQARNAELYGWRSAPKGRLAEILVLDQFSRNMFRDTPKAFSQDAMALVLAQEAVAAGALEMLSRVERGFLLMPFMHSESRLIHEAAESLFREFTAQDSYKFELRHKAIIDRFGRYPHRNIILGRVSTPEEIEFLKQPGAGF